jgi:hypothetical protein
VAPIQPIQPIQPVEPVPPVPPEPGGPAAPGGQLSAEDVSALEEYIRESGDGPDL